MQNKNNNRSLFLYTALIFIAAILIIIVAFFGQQNLDQSRVELTEVETENAVNDGISLRASQISEQNALLTTQNETLNTLNKELLDDKESLEVKNNELEINYSNGNLLCTIYQYIYDKNYDDAREVLSSINTDALTDAQKIIYNNIKKILN